jgi:hypothetical protein
MAYGGEFILRPRSWRRLGRFAVYAVAAALSPSSYSQKSREMAVQQIYLFAWKVLAGYLAFAALLGAGPDRGGNASSPQRLQYALELVLRAGATDPDDDGAVRGAAVRSIAAEIGDARQRPSSRTARMPASPLNSRLVPRIVTAAASITLRRLACAVAVG